MRAQSATDQFFATNGRAMYRDGKANHPTPLKLVHQAVRLNNFTDPDEIAQYLRDNNIKGKIASLGSCPLAQWAVSCGAQSAKVSNSTFTVSLVSDADWEDVTDGDYVAMPNTAAMDLFIKKFDMGQYPDLIEVEVNA